jgi:hypothetical protein
VARVDDEEGGSFHFASTGEFLTLKRKSKGGRVLRVTVRGSGVPTVVLGSGETLLIGREPQSVLPELEPEEQLRYTPLALPQCAAHVSRLLGELEVGEEVVRLRWHGGTEAQLSSLLDAPGGARRVVLTEGMTAQFDDGENQLAVLRGRHDQPDVPTDHLLVVEAAMIDAPSARPLLQPARGATTRDAPGLVPGGREWFVALALAEPWLTGADDYPRPPTNREIYERVLGWHGYAWNLERSQRVDEAMRRVSRVAFGRRDDPFRVVEGKRVSNVRFAVGRRAAEVRLVTAQDLADVERRR